MIDLRPILLVVGFLVAMLGCTMLLPAAVDYLFEEGEWRVFAATGILSLFVGVALVFANRGQASDLNIKQAFLLTVISWVVLTGFAALPFAWSRLDTGYTNAFFEAMSGLTTTGSTVLTNLDAAPKSILFWRALLQWIGGIGIIVMAIAVLPMLQVGGMQLFRMESSDTSEKILPRATQIAGSIGLLYLLLTAICTACYWALEMDFFDAISHAMTTIATGGFSTHDQSFGHFQNWGVEIVCIIFMIVGSLPFALYIHAVRGRHDLLVTDSQVRWFMMLAGLFILLGWMSQLVGGAAVSWEGFRAAAFNVVSVMTGTGYATSDYGTWSNFAVTLFFFVMFVGGCAGSTSCGIKIFRLQVLFMTVKRTVSNLVQPHGVFIARYNGQPLPESVPAAVIGFLFLYLVCVLVTSFILGQLGLDMLSALSAAATAISNVGPALGPEVGPAETFANIPDSAKWVLSFGMLLGRLELFTVLVLFSPAFWRA